jgi:hypothetical protein
VFLIGPYALFALCFFSDFDDLATRIKAAFRTDSMMHPHLATVRALHQVNGSQRVVRTAAITSSFGNLTLW